MEFEKGRGERAGSFKPRVCAAACGVGSEPLTDESAISVPDAGSSSSDAMAGLVRGKNGQQPRHEAGALGFELMIVIV